MKQYQQLDVAGTAFQTGRMSIPTDPMNTDYRRMLAEVEAGEAELLPPEPTPAPPTNQELASALDFDERVFRAFALVVLDQINAIRAEAGLATYTVQQLKNAVAVKMADVA